MKIQVMTIQIKYLPQKEYKLEPVRKTKELVNSVPEHNSTRHKLHKQKIQPQELKDTKVQIKDNQTKPNTTKGRVFKTYEIDQEKKELLRQR